MSDLLGTASHYNLSDVKTSILKREIKNAIQFLVDEKNFEPAASSHIVVSQTDKRKTPVEPRWAKQQTRSSGPNQLKSIALCWGHHRV